jgi:hypothetical protein
VNDWFLKVQLSNKGRAFHHFPIKPWIYRAIQLILISQLLQHQIGLKANSIIRIRRESAHFLSPGFGI